MSYRKFKKSLAKSLSVLVVTPIVVNFVLNDPVVSNASIASRINNSARNLSRRVSSISTPQPNHQLNATSNLGRPSAQVTPSSSSLPLYRPTLSEKVLAGFGIGLGAVSLVGTAVGIGLTEKQYEQTKSTYDHLVDKSYKSFYQEREDYMKDLFDKWGVPMPDKYKNPFGNENKSELKPSPGFSIGKGE